MAEESQAKVVGDTTEKWLEWKCVFCKQDPKDAIPKLLPCLHSCCGTCLIDELSNDDARPKCPVCIKEFNQSDVIDNYFVKKQPSGSHVDNGSPLCTNCEDSNAATSFCIDCTEWLCDACVQAHQRVKLTKDHNIRSKDNATQETNLGCRQLFCMVHKQEPLKLFCETCDQLTCRDCQLVAHRDHKYQFVSDAYKQQRAQIQMMMVQLNEQKIKLELAQQTSNRMYDDLVRKEETIREEIKQFALKFIAEVGQRSRQLTKDLHNTCNHKKMKLTAINSYLASTISKMNYKLSFIKTALEQDNDLALLYSKRTLMKQLETLRHYIIQSPPVGAIVDVRFLYDMNALVNFVSKFGMLLFGGVSVNSLGPVVSAVNTIISTDPNGNSLSTSTLQGTQQSSSQVSSTISATGHSKNSVLFNLLDHPQLQGIGPGSVRPTGTYMPPSAIPNSIHSSRHPLPSCRPNINTPRQMMQDSAPPNVFLRPSVPGTSNHSRQQFFHPTQQNFQPQQTLRQSHYYHQNRQLLQQLQQSSQHHPQQIQRQQLLPQTSPQPRLIASALHPPPPSYTASRPSCVTVSSIQQMSAINRPFTPQLQQSCSQNVVQTNSQNLPQPYSQSVSPFSSPNLPPSSSQNSIPASVVEQYTGIQVTSVGTSGRSDSNSISPIENGILSWSGSPISLSLSDEDLFQDRLNAVQPKVTSSGIPSSSGAAVLPIKVEKSNDVESLCRLLESHDASSSMKIGVENPEKVVQADSSSSPTSDQLPLNTATGIDQNGRSPLCLEHQSDEASTHDSALDLDLKRDDDVLVLPPPTPPPLSIVDLTSDGEAEEAESEETSQLPKIIEVATTSLSQFSAEDPNEDWCAVCHDGGELLCCGSCPRVYHLECHVPLLPASAKDEDSWKCLICESVSPLPADFMDSEKRKSDTMSLNELKICQRILLELFCHEFSTAFHKRVSKTVVPEYYRVITKPMHLEKVKKKLQMNRYPSWREFVADIRLLFSNCFAFNAKGTEIHTAGVILKEIFEKLLLAYNLMDTKVYEDSESLCDIKPRKRLRTSAPANAISDKEEDSHNMN